ncbi:MAG: hypothetical protein B5M48_01025 [Candidatus Omnitrophica bacterium 4484_213]|nr:MAG: hypothetical protein B5M48_01025 [Candidatus Omnitrophica bacterium 4484_213]
MRPIKLLSSVFYLGYLPLFPGTWGSLAGVLIYLLANQNKVLYSLITAAVIGLGFLVCGKAEEIYHRKDPSCVVIDELAGMLIALFLIPSKLFLIIIAFSLFRFLDILKLGPIKKIEQLKGSKGIMLDDIFAGLMTNVIVHLIALIKI